MAKVTGSHPADVTLRLHAPGMSPLHRAGLGGLAASLLYIEQAYGQMVRPKDAPGGPWLEAKVPPWSVTSDAIQLRWGEPATARDYLRRLFCLCFGLRDGLIDLPGQYGPAPPPLEVRASLQQGLTLTFLQHGKVRTLAKTPTVCQYDPEGDGKAMVSVQYAECTGYRHQKGWEDLIDAQGCWSQKSVEVVGPLSPGSMVRHNLFPADTKIEATPELLLPLYFALVGCVALSVDWGHGVLLIPDVTDLQVFARSRWLLTPRRARDCRVASAGDAALQAQVRIRSMQAAEAMAVPGCGTATFRPPPWSSQQKCRVSAFHVPAAEDKQLEIFADAMALLPPRIIPRKANDGEGKTDSSHKEYFWADSVIRPLIADNLAVGKSWYTGFAGLLTARDPDNSKKWLRDRIPFEKKGLHAMIDKIPWEHEGEAVLVKAVHEAMRCRKGAIAEENKGNLVAMKNRWNREDERLRLALMGAKTADQVRQALCNLFGRAGTNKVLQEGWRSLLPMLSSDRWQSARDLALLASASYRSQGETDETTDTPTLKQGEQA